MHAALQLGEARWLGDSRAQTADYYRLINELFEEIGVTDEFRRDFMALHMANSKDAYIMADMAQFRRSAGGDRRD